MKTVEIIRLPEDLLRFHSCIAFIHKEESETDWKPLIKSHVSVVMSNLSLTEMIRLTLENEYGNDITIKTVQFEPQMAEKANILLRSIK